MTKPELLLILYALEKLLEKGMYEDTLELVKKEIKQLEAKHESA